MSLEEEAPKEGEEKEKKPKEYAYAELMDLNNSGKKFDDLVQRSLQHLAADELSKYNLYLPDVIAADKADGTTPDEDMQHYEELLVDDKVPQQEYLDSIEAVK